ncbi:MAG: MATE family efflux transporter [Clostridia bacterium]|nr:MATE family efflux transporter [Clostridia bacterium]
MALIKPNRLIGDRAFYKTLITVALPIMLQNGITEFVSLLDNIMIGHTGTEQYNAVVIVNQLVFVYAVCVFGAIAGAGIFSAQFHGNRDEEGVRNAFRFKLYAAGAVMLVAAYLFIFHGDDLISLYLHDTGEEVDLALTLEYGLQYLHIILICMVPHALTQVYASTLRETGKTVPPMIAGSVALLVNLVGNYLLIFGNFGIPEMGVRGAALATALARFVEFGIVAVYTHANKKKNPFAKGLYRTLLVPRALIGKIMVKGVPLLANEILWSGGMAVLAQCYSVRGPVAVGAYGITSTMSNMFGIAMLALGNAVAIIVGQKLGAGEIEEAKIADSRLIFTSTAACAVIGGVMALTAPLFPQLFSEVSEESRALAVDMIRIAGLILPFNAFAHSTYFTLRSGGRTLFVFAFDSGFMWLLCVPTAFILGHLTSIPLVPMYAIVLSLELIKCVLGFFFVKSGFWAKNLIKES